MVENLELTVDLHRDRVLHEVGSKNHHAGEDLDVFERGVSDQQVVLVVNADAVGIVVYGVDGCTVSAELFDQEITGGAIVPFLGEGIDK